MSENSPRRTRSLRDLIYFPVAYNAVGLALLGLSRCGRLNTPPER